MAVNPSAKSNYLSKVQLNGGTYWVKDAELRELLESAATKTAIEQIITSGEGANNTNSTIPTTLALTSWLETQIAGLTGAMHFMGVTDPEAGETPAARIEALYQSKSATPAAGDIVIDGTAEYVYDGSAWKELGDEGTYATKAELETAVSGIQIAGVALGNDHAVTASELITALGLKALAFKDEAAGKVSTVDSGSVSIPAATLTLAGTAITVPQSYKAMDVTPAGNVTVTDVAKEISYDKFASASVVVPDASAAKYEKVSGIVITSGSEGIANYTPAGSVSVSADAAAAFNAETTTVATVTNQGTAYSLTEGSVSQAADTTSNFVTSGVTAAMDATDTEMLVFSAAPTGAAVTAAGTVTYTNPTLSGSLPTFGSAEVAGVRSTISLPAFSGSFSGTGAVLSATANFANADITGITTTTAALSNLSFASTTVTIPAGNITAAFAGTTKSVTPEVDGTASAAPMAATAAVAAQTITVDFVRTDKDITVK